MKNALLTLSSLALQAVSAQAQSTTSGKIEPKADDMRRLQSVTWDLKTHTLKWTVEKGTEVDSQFVPSSAEHYEITPDQATMTSGSEKRSFAQDEAALLHRLLDTISLYCAQSVIWWEHGEGTRVMDNEPARPLPLGVAEAAKHLLPSR